MPRPEYEMVENEACAENNQDAANWKLLNLLSPPIISIEEITDQRSKWWKPQTNHGTNSEQGREQIWSKLQVFRIKSIGNENEQHQAAARAQ